MFLKWTDFSEKHMKQMEFLKMGVSENCTTEIHMNQEP